jgi:Helitron helicase-like domain at N-terminus
MSSSTLERMRFKRQNKAFVDSQNARQRERRRQQLSAQNASNSTPIHSHYQKWFHKLPKVQRPIVFKWSKQCTKCNAKLLNVEDDQWCCYKGRLHIEQLPLYPEEMQFLFLEENLSTTNQLCRKLNNLFSFSVLGVHMGSFKHFNGPANVVLQGRTYHRLIDVTKGEHSLRWFLYDEAERTSTAMRLKIPLALTERVRLGLGRINPYVEYARLLERSNIIEDEENQQPISQSSAPIALELRTNVASGEIAAIIHTSNFGNVSPRSVLLWKHGNDQPEFLSILSEHYEPLQYPLLFPHGTLGWGKVSREYRNITQIEWYRYRLLTEKRFLSLGRLTCEYLVDMYSRVEDERLTYIRYGRKLQHKNQKTISQDQFSADNADDSNIFVDPEENFLLPASFTHSRLWASNQVADALTLCREFGKPSLFLTMTTNPNWPEIKECLTPGQNASDIPIIVCRVFNAKIKKLYEIMKEKFGGLSYFVRVIEFQKRGLPHAHMILKVCKKGNNIFTYPQSNILLL